MKKLLFLLFTSFLHLCSFGQNETCGTDLTPQDNAIIQQFIANSKTNNLKALGDTIVPVKFHVIRNTNGTNGIDSLNLFNELNTVNAFYSNAGIEFQHCGNINYIDDSQYTYFEKYVDEVVCDAHDVTNVLNIYFTPLIYKVVGIDTSILCGYAYSTSITKNRVLMKNSCALNGSTLSHEIGHYFSLAHTHSTLTGAELVNGSNCATAGDQLCDTPADPQLSTAVVNTSCIYTGTAQDSNNDFYNPEVRNIMSYSRKTCRNLFSPDQYARMNTYLLNYRNYLVCPSSVSIEEKKKEIKFSIAPNPTTNQSFLYIENTNLTTQLSITDVTGKLIYKGKLPQQNKINITEHISTTGVYFISVYNDSGSITKKLIKH